ncbi:RteC protein [Dysgonomonas alginatilytica]|uniref:RteC protein n=1 Tax=Dysgonomonas alginatilytica TaxID=1605892 RepID=A0A2V3PKU4_9BACT|nr:RteC domain-containing protein [Dysgonomonas alginatilytica]PXV61112.1 RteC protein [Dysgonomonas alginatilytica]
MKKYTCELIEKLNYQLKIIDLEEENIFVKAPKAIELLEGTFVELKSFVFTYSFKGLEEEIYFFKDIKPQLFSKLIYYRKIYNIETIRPNGSLESQKAHFKKELDHIKTFFDRNLDFYKYYRTGCTHFDKYYFVRGKPDIQLNLDSFYFERDPTFSTSFDFKIAKILANEMLSIYLNGELVKLETYSIQPYSAEPYSPMVKLTWTGKKAELVEQIYGWEGTSCFNNGNVNIKELTEYIEYVFNINLGDYYHTFLEMRDRKGSRTIFLDKLIKYLNGRMDEADNK